jgi:hypothetical protein
MSSEGPYRTAAATIDDCGDIALLNWRCESPNDNESVPWLSVGATTLVRNLLVRGQLEAADFGVYAIAYDNYEGPLPQVRFRTGTNRRAYSYTANTKFSDVRAPDVDFGYPFAPTNLDHTVKPAQNLLPNPRMEGLRWGCYNAVTAATSGTIALTSEPTIVRDGASALKIASATAGTFQRAELRYNDPWCQTYRSKSVTLAGWVYIPNLASMDASDGAAPTYPVQLEIRSYDSVTGETSIASSSSNRQIANGWNFIHCTGTLHSLTDEVRIRVWVNNSSTATTGSSTEYVVVDSLYLCPGDVWRDIYEGRVVQSPLAAGDVIGGRLVVRMTSSAATTLIADTTQTFQVGDTIHYTDAASGGVPGIYCTTGGAGGTAVFRNMAALA